MIRLGGATLKKSLYYIIYQFDVSTISPRASAGGGLLRLYFIYTTIDDGNGSRNLSLTMHSCN